jgi:predicted GTPase
VIAEQRVTTAVLAYSDLAMVDVAELGARVRAAGANFMLLGRCVNCVVFVYSMLAGRMLLSTVENKC